MVVPGQGTSEVTPAPGPLELASPVCSGNVN